MHIGIDARLPAYQMGGISQYVLLLLRALGQLDEQNRYTVVHSRRDSVSRLPVEAPNFERMVAWTPCHHRWERWALWGEIGWRGFDVWHSPDFIPPQGGGKRRIITVHDLNFLHYPQFLTAESRRYYGEQIGWATAVADHILADSEHTRQDLIELLGVPGEKVTTVPLAANPLYHDAFEATVVAETLAKFNLPQEFILFVGTLEPRKNVIGLLEAYYLLRQEEKVTLPLVLVGRKGWLYDEIFAQIKALGLSESVIHLEGVYDRMLAHLYTAASVLALPSHYEGFGLPVLEGMHCGCPVVCSDRASLPEVGGEAAKLLPPDDSGLWAETLGRVLHDSQLREEMIQAGYRQAKRFNWHRTAEQTLAVYRGYYG
ncbi:MAG TPA: glycosyltransferase family 1 protein [Anaerolineae bacterium]|nr:glycosyltransferase family 1 protein [Anaerolineae bacterium]